MKNLFKAALVVLASCFPVSAEFTKTIYSPFTQKLDYITRIDTNTIVPGTNVTVSCLNGACTVNSSGGGGGGSATLPLPGGASNYVQISNTLQPSSTFYVSSGTVAAQLRIGPNNGSRTDELTVNGSIGLGQDLTGPTSKLQFYLTGFNNGDAIDYNTITPSGIRFLAGGTTEIVKFFSLDIAGASRRGMALRSTGSVRMYDGDNSNYVSLRSSNTVSANVEWVLPEADGIAGQPFVTDGGKNLLFDAGIKISTITGTTNKLLVQASTTTFAGYVEQSGNIISPSAIGQPKGAYFQATSTGNPNGQAVPSGLWGQLNYNTVGPVTSAHGLGVFGRVWVSSQTQGFAGGVEGNCHSSSTWTTAYCVGVIGHASWNSDGLGTSSQMIGLYSLPEIYQADETTPRSTGTAVGYMAYASVGGALKYGIYQAGVADENVYFGKTVNVPGTAQTISEGTVIKDDQCGTVKMITSTAAVTTNSTSTFVATSIAIDQNSQTINAGCRMNVCNTGSFAITLKSNAGTFFTHGGGDVKLYTGSCMEVVGTGSFWLQTAPATSPSNQYVSTGTVRNGNYTMNSTDSIVLSSAIVSGSTVTLPAATNAGQMITITKVDLSSGSVTLLAAGANTIFDLTTTSVKLWSNSQSQTLIADGVNRWDTVGDIAETPSYLGDNADTTLAANVQVANAAFVTPIDVVDPVTVTGVRFVVGTQNGNMDVGIYSLAANILTRVASSGSTTVPATGASTINFTTRANLKPSNGPYFLAVAADGIIATFHYKTGNGYRCRGYLTSFPLPANITYSGFATDNSTNFSLLGVVAGGI